MLLSIDILINSKSLGPLLFQEGQFCLSGLKLHQIQA